MLLLVVISVVKIDGLKCSASGRTETAGPASETIGETIQVDRPFLPLFYTYADRVTVQL